MPSETLHYTHETFRSEEANGQVAVGVKCVIYGERELFEVEQYGLRSSPKCLSRLQDTHRALTLRIPHHLRSANGTPLGVAGARALVRRSRLAALHPSGRRVHRSDPRESRYSVAALLSIGVGRRHKRGRNNHP